MKFFRRLLGRRRRTPRSRNTSVTVDIPLLRWVGPVVTVVAMFIILGMVVGGQINLAALDDYGDGEDGSSQLAGLTPVRLDSGGPKSNEAIRIATLHVDRLGDGDGVSAESVTALVSMVSRFDIVALQGIQGSGAASIRSLVDVIRVSGGRYTASISEPIGRGNNLQSYALIWDESRMRIVPGAVGIVDDSRDRMMFEPMYASFETRVGFADGRRPFRFTLINAWAIDQSQGGPSDETSVLVDVFTSVRNYGYELAGEEDCILLGDLGATSDRLGALGQIPGVVSVVADGRNSQHILLDPNYTAEFTRQAGVLSASDLPEVSADALRSVSSQMPVWAELSVWEVPTMETGASSRTEVIR
ncbi:hypothetical protein K227x_28010 [Rubripirellula lacrimiformis]|uniref:Endonuclease/Exonuclease/phosphatase family protein n=2 Tax=Rubripirellula lacrimiformis TaxID=1930273 RepID=A0A517NBB1_9BACT|nr:hypothetical protein K227x_28010 [Rubripirellula lacrimiformis]